MAHKRRMTAKRRRFYDSSIFVILSIVSVFAILVLVAVAAFLLINSIPAFTQVNQWGFFTGTVWDPTNPIEPLYGMVPLLVSTLIVTFVSALIAIPIGLGATIYLAEIAHPKIRKVMKPAVEVLAGIPSVVLGFFALTVFAKFMWEAFAPAWRPSDYLNLFNGAVFLAIMMVPIMVSLSEDAVNSVPRSLKEASMALGMTRWETVWKVIIPAARPGIVAAVMLSIGRAVGETMVVVMATGSSPQLTFDPFSSGQPITSTIAIEMGEVAANTPHYYVLFELGLVLFAITFALNYVADWTMRRHTERYQ
ncbi:MAG: phosphate ABC transporter permease subunit PstC [Methanomassiliicoccales archaeon]|nr:phosphate ABC transporter permease subunit PstC [Methanomassiliicoccales archaeon]